MSFSFEKSSSNRFLLSCPGGGGGAHERASFTAHPVLPCVKASFPISNRRRSEQE